MSRRRLAVLLAALVACGAFFATARAAWAAFPSSPTLDTFASDATLHSGWTTPALGENPMVLATTSSGTKELTGSLGNGNAWSAALWNTPSAFSNPVEVWAGINRAGTNDVALYADVVGGESGAIHPSGGYFADFGGSTSVGSANRVSIWRIEATEEEYKLTYVNAPYTNLQPGDQVGLSVTNGVITAWYKPAGGSWTAVVSTVDKVYSSGAIALEDIPGPAYGFSVFGGGTPSAPVVSTTTATSIGSSAPSVNVGQPVTYTATVAPVPSAPRGTVAFLDGGVQVPGCSAQPISAGGQATCALTYNALGSHTVSAIYTGSPTGAFAGSINIGDATVNVTQASSTALSMSSATPVVGAKLALTAHVSPAQTGGTVSFVADGSAIKACTGLTVTNGVATCTTSYRSPGVHQILASYSGDAGLGASVTAPAEKITVSLAPRLVIGKRAFAVTLACPPHSGGCRLKPIASVVLPGAKGPLSLGRLSVRLRADHSTKVLFTLSHAAQAKVRAATRHHPHLTVNLQVIVQDGNGTSGTQAFAYRISGARRLAAL